MQKAKRKTRAKRKAKVKTRATPKAKTLAEAESFTQEVKAEDPKTQTVWTFKSPVPCPVCGEKTLAKSHRKDSLGRKMQYRECQETDCGHKFKVLGEKFEVKLDRVLDKIVCPRCGQQTLDVSKEHDGLLRECQYAHCGHQFSVLEESEESSL